MMMLMPMPMPKLPVSLASRLCAVLSPARTGALSTRPLSSPAPAPAALQRNTAAAAASTHLRSALPDVLVTRLAPSKHSYPEYDPLMPCPPENIMPRVEHLVALKEGNIVDFVSNALNLPPLSYSFRSCVLCPGLSNPAVNCDTRTNSCI